MTVSTIGSQPHTTAAGRHHEPLRCLEPADEASRSWIVHGRKPPLSTVSENLFQRPSRQKPSEAQRVDTHRAASRSSAPASDLSCELLCGRVRFAAAPSCILKVTSAHPSPRTRKAPSYELLRGTACPRCELRVGRGSTCFGGADDHRRRHDDGG